MPHAVLADHLLSGVDSVATTTASLAFWCLLAGVGSGGVQCWCGGIGAYQSGGMAEAETLGAEKFAITGAAMNFLVGAIAGQH